ncbi:MAG: S8 family serine peptidase [Actinomycetota bacterium]
MIDVVLATSLLLAPTTAQVEDVAEHATSAGEPVTVLVTVADGHADEIDALVEAIGGEVTADLRTTTGVIVADVPDAALAALAADDAVASLDLDEVVWSTPFSDPVDERTATASDLGGASTDDGWAIVVLDTGFDTGAAGLAGRVRGEACFRTAATCPDGTASQIGAGAAARFDVRFVGAEHGTQVATIAGDDNGAGLYLVNVFEPGPTDECRRRFAVDECLLSARSSQLAALDQVVRWATDDRIAAVNLSFGDQPRGTCDDGPLAGVIGSLTTSGVAVVAASGSQGVVNGLAAPACVTDTVSVGVLDDTGTGVDPLSNTAPTLDLLARGNSGSLGLLAEHPGILAGTSFAAPRVSNAIAALRSVHPDATVPELVERLRRTGPRVVDDRTRVITPALDLPAALVDPAPPPSTAANDDASTAFVLDGVFGQIEGSTFGAGAEPGEAAHAGAPAATSVWFSFVAPSTGMLRLSTAGSSIDPRLAVYDATTSLSVAGGRATSEAGTAVVELVVERGRTYRIALDAVGLPGRFRLTWDLRHLHSPDLSAATVLSAPSGSVTGDTAPPTLGPGTDASGTTLWFRFVAPESGTVAFSASGSPSVVTAYRGDDVQELAVLAAPAPEISVDVTADTEVLLTIEAGEGPGGPVTLTWDYESVGHDDLEAARVLDGEVGAVLSSNRGSDRDPDEPLHADNDGGASVWFRWTAPSDGVLEVTTAGSTFDTLLAIYDEEAVVDRRLAHDDDHGTAVTSRLRTAVREGRTYLIAVDSFRYQSGRVARGDLRLGWRLDRPDSTSAAWWLVGADGGVFSFGGAPFHGSAAGVGDVVDLAATADGDGHWLLRRDGRVATLGDARELGGIEDRLVDGDRAVAIASTPTSRGYWIATSGGRVHAVGDAPDLGTLDGIDLNGQIVGMSATWTGLGLALVAGDGGVFTLGDAEFVGSMGGVALNEPVVDLALTPSGQGYWLVGRDGGVFAFGDAAFRGSLGSLALNGPIEAIVAIGAGYLLVGADGGLFNFSDQPFLGSLADEPLSAPVVAAVPLR